MKMNKTFKMAAGFGIVSVVAAMFAVLDNQRTDTTELVANTQADKQLFEPVKTPNVEVKGADIKQTEISAEQIKRKIDDLIAQADQAYMEIVNLTGEYEARPLNYEDNWCIPSEDLSEQDNIYAKKQMDEWKLSRVEIVPQELLNDMLARIKYEHTKLEGVNDEYLAPYKDADRDTLIRLAEQDDILALYTLHQGFDKYQLDRQTQLIVSEKLVILGDTNRGLNTLVVDNVSRAKFAMRADNREQAVGYIKTALALVEYGAIRNDITIIDSILSFDGEMADVTYNIMSSFTESDYEDINKNARWYYEQFNNARAERGLISFDDIEEGKITDIIHARKLSFLYMQYEDLLTGSLIPQSWKESYLRKTPCTQRLIARRDFRKQQLPVFRQKIAELEKSLAELQNSEAEVN